MEYNVAAPELLILEERPPVEPRGVSAARDSSKPARKKLVKRENPDYSQRLRLGFQLLFLTLNVWIGVLFYGWVRWAETGARSLSSSRPAGVEGWLPIEGLMQLKYVLATGHLPELHPAGFFLFVAFLATSWLLRKSFCAWLCPVGTLSEYLWKLGRSTFRKTFHLPHWLDLPLRSLKYLLLAFFAYAVFMMPANSIAEFVASPYGLIVDVRMLNFFRYLGTTAALVMLGLVVSSIFVQNFWCRYLCPYGALMGLAALLSPVRITRSPDACIDCAKCAKACPSALAVDQLMQIRSAECTGCLECVAVCPAQDALDLEVISVNSRTQQKLPAWSLAAAIALLFLGITGYAKLSGHWDTHLPDRIYFQLVPLANQQQHPPVP